MIGDHIRALKGGRWAHAIDCGDQTVLHVLEDPSLPSGNRIRRTYRPEFVADAETVEIVTHRERVYPPKAVVSRAYSRLTDVALASMFRDSAGFARWCKTGRLPDAEPNVAVVAPAAAKPGKESRSKKAAPKALTRRRPAPKKAKKNSAAKKSPAARKAATRKTAAKRKPPRKTRRRR